MTDLTREEWDAARERLSRKARDIPLNVFPAELDGLAEAVLGCPRPPEPAPPHHSVHGRVVVTQSLSTGLVCVGWTVGDITPDEADAMACSLIEHAAYARKQEARQEQDEAREGWKDYPPVVRPPPDICGRVLVGRGGDTWDPVCQKPSGHTEFCQKGYDE